MREIKFRAWDKVLFDITKGNRMFEVYGLNISTNYVSAYKETGDEVIHDLRDCILMQYTGLKDKKGKEIYEGDIIKLAHGHNGIIEFQKGCFVVAMKGENNYCYCELKFYSPEHREIIGNIYENSELLEVK